MPHQMNNQRKKSVIEQPIDLSWWRDISIKSNKKSKDNYWWNNRDYPLWTNYWWSKKNELKNSTKKKSKRTKNRLPNCVMTDQFYTKTCIFWGLFKNKAGKIIYTFLIFTLLSFLKIVRPHFIKNFKSIQNLRYNHQKKIVTIPRIFSTFLRIFKLKNCYFIWISIYSICEPPPLHVNDDYFRTIFTQLISYNSSKRLQIVFQHAFGEITKQNDLIHTPKTSSQSSSSHTYPKKFKKSYPYKIQKNCRYATHTKIFRTTNTHSTDGNT